MEKFRILVLICIIAPSAFFTSCGKRSMDGMVIFTQADIAGITGENVTAPVLRPVPGARIAAVDPLRPQKSYRVLTEGFYSASSPAISFDGKSMLFAGQKEKDGTWQIWEMNLKSLKTRQITKSAENSTNPAYLPGGRFVFCRQVDSDSIKAGSSIFTASLNGSSVSRLTYNPYTYSPPAILMDGRILAASRQLYPEIGPDQLVILRPDGTKAEMFCRAAVNSSVTCRPCETNDGRVVFIETDTGTAGTTKLISVNYNRPLFTRHVLNGTIQGRFSSVAQQTPGRLIATYRDPGDSRYGLYEFEIDKNMAPHRLFADSGYDIIDAVAVGEHAKPKNLPSEVDMSVKTGLLLCQDINFIYPKAGADGRKAEKIEVLGLNSSLGVVQVEEDGSFYLKPLADTPFRIRTLDNKGNVINGPCEWIWLRPNERRGCTGCHEDQELAPDNRMSFAVKKAPVLIPVHLKKIIEKTIELE